MNLNLSNSLKDISFKNDYRFILTDSITGEVKQDFTCHNIIVNNYWTRAIVTSASGSYAIFPNYLWVGTGTDVVPSVTDTSLKNPIWRYRNDKGDSYLPNAACKVSNVSSIRYESDYIAERDLTFVFPATADYVATGISEVGLCTYYYSEGSLYNYYYTNLCTHCVLTDVEGNPMTIDKTDTDVLTIIVTFKLILNVDNEHNDFQIVGNVRTWPYSQLLNSANRQPIFTTNMNYFLSSNKRIKFSHLAIQPTLSSSSDGPMFEQGHFRVGKSTYSTSTTDGLKRIFTMSKQRIGKDISNDFYYNTIALAPFGYISLPNEKYFPTYTLEPIEIGTGDGVTTEFPQRYSYFKEGSEKVYKNGILVDKSEYTINSKNNQRYFGWLSDLNDYYTDSEDNWFFNQTNTNGTEISIAKSSEKIMTLTEPRPINCIHIPVTAGSNHKYEVAYSPDLESDFTTVITKSDATVGHWQVEEPVMVQRVRIKNTNSSSSLYYDGCWNNFFVGTVSNGNLVFNTPPAQDEIITMSVDMDILYKDENYVIDVEFTTSF